MPEIGVLAPARIFVAVRAIAPVAGMPPKSGDGEIRDALGHQFDVGVMPRAAHAVRHDSREQAFYRRKECHGKGGGKQRTDLVKPERGKGEVGQSGGYTAEPAPDCFDGKAREGGERCATQERHNGAGNTLGQAGQ